MRGAHKQEAIPRTWRELANPTKKREGPLRESMLKCLGHHSHHREEKATWRWGGNRLTNCPDLPGTESPLPRDPLVLGKPEHLVTLGGRRVL